MALPPTLSYRESLVSPLRADDAAALLDTDDPQARRYFPKRKPPRTLSEASSLIDQAQELWRTDASRRRLAIRASASPELVGYVELWRYIPSAVRVEYLVRRRFRGKHHAENAAVMATTYAREAMGVRFVELEIDGANAPSLRIARSLRLERMPTRWAGLHPVYPFRVFSRKAWRPKPPVCWEAEPPPLLRTLQYQTR